MNTVHQNSAGISAEKSSIRELSLCAMFTILIIVGAFIKIPVPVVPFTLQFLFTLLAGLRLGGRSGAAAVALYAVLGLIGLPVFAEGGGIWYILKPSFGYILGFIFGTYVTGKLTERVPFTFGRILLSAFAGLAIVYGVGMAYYYVICNYVIHTPIAFGTLFFYCFLLAVPGDICLCFLGTFLAKRLRTIIHQMGGNS